MAKTFHVSVRTNAEALLQTADLLQNSCGDTGRLTLANIHGLTLLLDVVSIGLSADVAFQGLLEFIYKID